MMRRLRSGKRSKKCSVGPKFGLASGSIERLATDGAGVMRRADGKITFVPFSLPGETITCTVHTEKKSYARARLCSRESTSPVRSSAACSLFTKCGGCQIQHIAAEMHGELKKQWFIETCQRIGRWPEEVVGVLKEGVRVHELAPLRYRQRARFHLERASRDQLRAGVGSGGVSLGFRAEHPAEDVVDLGTDCPILVPEIEHALDPLRRACALHMAPGSRLQAEVTRHWLLGSAEPSLALTLFKDDRSRKEVDKQFLSDFLKTLAPYGFIHPPDDLLRICDSRGELPSSAFDSTGGSIWVHRLGFLQPHEQATSVYRSLCTDVARSLASELLGVEGGHRFGDLRVGAPLLCIWDLYGGCGVLSHAARNEFAAFGCQTHTVVVEQSAASLQAARAWHAKTPQVAGQTIDTRQMDTLDFLNLEHQFSELPVLIIADPPRSGLGADTCSALIRLCSRARVARGSACAAHGRRASEAPHAPRLLLVFCDPAACARDVAHFLLAGFRIIAVDLVDAFPQTHHYEVIVELIL